tara:strand:- start:201 stop:380 length:180 start_codon:yes stop_codon:yes gene_type:complete
MNGEKMPSDEWRKATNKIIAHNLVKNIASLLSGEIQYSTLVDHKGVIKRKVSITYQEEE